MYANSWRLSCIPKYYRCRETNRPIAHGQWTGAEGSSNPRSASYFHFIQLAAHDIGLGGQCGDGSVCLLTGRLHANELPLHHFPLPLRIRVPNPNGGHPHNSRAPETDNSHNLPTPIPFLAGMFLMGLAIIFLIYCVNRDDYFFYIDAFGGAVPFIIGALLIMFCLLPDPPSIFGLSIIPWH